jgi:ABC-type Zn uptake system ZnuABC Zn-binding protein ZnuA
MHRIALTSRPRLAVLAALASLVMLLFLGCSSKSDDNRAAQRSAATAKPGVIASTVPVYSLLLEVAGEDMPISLLPAPSQGSHSYQPTLKDRERLFGARAVFFNGLGLETWCDRGLRAELVRRGVRIVETGEALADSQRVAGGDSLDHAGHEHADHDHHHGADDPHLWLGKAGLLAMLSSVEQALSQLDPPRASGYAKRAAEHRAAIESAYAEAEAALKACSKKQLVTFHDAWRYMAMSFGLEVAQVVMPKPGEEGSLQHLERVRAAIKNVGTIFVEPQYDSTRVRALAAEVGAKVLVLDPGETSGDEPGPTFNLDVLKKNVAALVEGLK